MYVFMYVCIYNIILIIYFKLNVSYHVLIYIYLSFHFLKKVELNYIELN